MRAFKILATVLAAPLFADPLFMGLMFQAQVSIDYISRRFCK